MKSRTGRAGRFLRSVLFVWALYTLCYLVLSFNGRLDELGRYPVNEVRDEDLWKVYRAWDTPEPAGGKGGTRP